MPSLRSMIVVVAAAVGLTCVFWWTLWSGGGFVGGDVYSYYFPQKTLYAEALESGEVPLWNSRAGHGYPLVGESQTGVFYPFHLLFYSSLEINAAYNAIHLLHYLLAFVFTVLYSRKYGLSLTAALFAGLVYAYGWFPSRSCIEWAIIGGAWLPAALWCSEGFLQSRALRYAIGLALVLAVQMLAGHFMIAFITQLTLLFYVPLRLWFVGSLTSSREGKAPAEPLLGTGDRTVQQMHRPPRTWMAVALGGAMLGGFGLAAVQLLPTLELKRLSQRESADDHELDFGAIPVWYLSQTVMPWQWYSPMIDRDRLLQDYPPAFGARTNQVEAHLYFGLLPFALAAWGVVIAIRTGNRFQLLWLLLGIAALVYATGCLLPVTRHLPGFSYFQGPGRFGLVTTFAAALLGGFGLDRLLSKPTLPASAAVLAMLAVAGALLSGWSLVSDAALMVTQLRQPNPLSSGRWHLSEPMMVVAACISAAVCLIGFLLWMGVAVKSTRAARAGKMLVIACLFAATISDLWLVSRLVTYSPLIDDPPIRHLAESPVRELLVDSSGSVRLYAPGPNLPNILGLASTPPYLTFGPAVYFNPETMIPAVAESADDPVVRTSPEQLEWLRRAGVTHVLSFKPLDDAAWPARLLWQGHDPFLNRAWGRAGPLHLYELNFAGERGWGRVRFERPAFENRATIAEYNLHRIEIKAKSETGGRLILTDLMFPGWTVTVDGEEAEAITAEGMYRGIDLAPGEHTVVWGYEPASVYRGAAISAVTLLIVAAIAHLAFWHPRRLAIFAETLRGEKESTL